jgi:hypothetical protein
MRRHLTVAAVLVILAGFGLLFTRAVAQKASVPAVVNPATLKTEYRAGGYFPRGFPLHGKIRLLTSPVVEMGQRVRVRVEYTVGDMPVETGMAIEVWKHFTSDVEAFQTENPDAPAYFNVDFSAAGVRARREWFTNWVQRNNPSVFPYRKAAKVILEAGSLKAGDKVNFDLGGPQGVRMQHYAENLFNFRFVITRDDKVLGYCGDAAMTVTGGPLHHLRVQAPSIVKVGEAFPIEVLPQDEWHSLANNHTGLAFRSELPATFAYDPELQHYLAKDAKAPNEGVLRIRVTTADGRHSGVSNPIWVENDPIRGIYFGDLHQHTYLADGRGVFEELYLYGRRVGLLDFGAVSPHHMPMSVSGPSFYLEGKKFPVEEWPALQKATRLINGWKGFVSILGYEYSVGTDVGGHHNVYYNADEAKSVMQLDPQNPMAPVGRMLQTLKLARKPVLVIPHIGGSPPDWSHPTDPRVERLFEVASVHGVFEESFQKHLESGQRLAASASGDTHTVAFGNAYPGLIYTMTNALTGVYALGKNRDDIWRGMYERRTFGTTGNTRILLAFDVNGEPMGGELAPGVTTERKISARVSGTAPIVKLDLLRNNKVIHSITPARNRGRLLRVIWGDNLYQRRAALGMRKGSLRPAAGALKLVRTLHLDQAFEIVLQEGPAVSWETAAVSNDRDGMLVDLSGVAGDSLQFRLDDSDTTGLHEVRIPLAELNRSGYFTHRAPAKQKHPYLEKMGVQAAFYLECELVDENAPLDAGLAFEDRTPWKAGDYYYLRAEQLDTNKAWSSPVWLN